VHLDDALQGFKEYLAQHHGDASDYAFAPFRCTRISSSIPWDVCSMSFQECVENPLIAAIFNVDGRRELIM
jgi:hypothetical protein